MQVNEQPSLANVDQLRQVVRMVPLSFANQEFALTTSGALYWPNESALLVADLHLEKAPQGTRH